MRPQRSSRAEPSSPSGLLEGGTSAFQPNLIRKEGETLLSVPESAEPKMLPAFFNPRGKFVRDVSLVAYAAYASEARGTSLNFADSLSGVGSRGIRVGNELPDEFSRVFLNDINSKALEFARQSIELNGVEKKCVLSRSEVTSFLSSREPNDGERFDCVDIDPFGTPSDYIDCAIRAVKDGGLLSVTATDSAVLCGVYPKVAIRKYLGTSLRTDYSQEMGLRLLFGLISQTAMRLDAGIEPLFCHHDMHYFRAYCKIRVGNSRSRENEPQIGYVLHCFSCGERSVVRRGSLFTGTQKASEKRRQETRPQTSNDLQSGFLRCPTCLGRLTVGGPCWIGNIQSREFVRACAERSNLLALFSAEEIDVPLYYDLTAISKKAKSRTPKIQSVMEELREMGYATSRTRLNPNALRTEAPIGEVRFLVEKLAR